MPRTTRLVPSARPATGVRRPAAALAVAATTAALVSGVPGTAFAAPVVHRSSDLLAPTTVVSPRAGMSDLAAAATAAGGAVRVASVLPASVDLTGFAVPAGDQGRHGSCVSWTTAYTIGGWESNYTRHAGAPFGPLYVYNQVNAGQDDGTYFDDNFAVLEDQGDVEAADWTHGPDDILSQPTADEQADAALHVMSAHTTLFAGWSSVGAAAKAPIETALANNQPVALGLPVYGAFDNLNSSHSSLVAADIDPSTFRGWHAVTALGYDAQGVIIENSWGPYWGNRGFARLGWDFVEQYVREAYAAGTFAPNGLVPSITALSAGKVSTAGGNGLGVSGLRLLNIDTTRPSAVSFVSVADPSVSVDAASVSRTSSGLSVITPRLAAGDWRVVVTGINGLSVPNGTADVVTAVETPTIGLPAGTYGPTGDYGVWIPVTGSGFGATQADFDGSGISATVGDEPTDVIWDDDSQVELVVYPEAAGTRLPLTIWRDGVPSSVTLTFGVPAAPVVTGLQPARVSTSGTKSVTVTVADGTVLGDSPTVSLVSTTTPTVLTATITGRTATTLTATVPASPDARSGDFHVIVGGLGGSSTAGVADVLGYRVPLAARPASALVAGNGGRLTLTGSGFGSSATAFAAAHITAVVGSRAVALQWLSATAVSVTLPAGTPGAAIPVVLRNDSVPGPAASGAKYGAVITASTARSGAHGGWTTTLSGVGFTGSGSWTLVNSAKRTVAGIPVVTTRTALSAARHGAVLIASGTTATVKLPGLAVGTYTLHFVPSQRSYPGASMVASSYATVVYR